MKVACIIILATCMQVSATGYSQDTRLSLDMRKVPIGKVLKAIEFRTDYHFVYSTSLFPSNRLVTVVVRDVPVSEILHQILEKTGFTFKKVDDLNILTPGGSGGAGGGTIADAYKEIQGRVIASATGEPLAGVTISVEGTGISTGTDGKGQFSIRAPDNGVLVISYVGFITQKVPVAGRTSIDVILKESSKDMNEVIVIGYGTRRRGDLTTAVSEIGTAEIEKSTAVSPELAMKGQMAGVQVTTGGGDPSSRPVIRIRGVSTFDVADPLYVIDGVPIAEGGAGATVDAVNDPTRRTPINLYTIL